MRFENAKHFLHIDSYVRVIAAPYGVGRLNGSSKLLPYHRFVRKGYSHTVWREAPIYPASPNAIYFLRKMRYLLRKRYIPQAEYDIFSFSEENENVWLGMKICG